MVPEEFRFITYLEAVGSSTLLAVHDDHPRVDLGQLIIDSDFTDGYALYDIDQNTWSACAAAPAPPGSNGGEFHHRVFCRGDRAYAFEDRGRPRHSPTLPVLYYTPSTNTWCSLLDGTTATAQELDLTVLGTSDMLSRHAADGILTVTTSPRTPDVPFYDIMLAETNSSQAYARPYNQPACIDPPDVQVVVTDEELLFLREQPRTRNLFWQVASNIVVRTRVPEHPQGATSPY